MKDLAFKLACAALLIAFAIPSASAGEPQAKIGHEAPVFVLTDTTDVQHSLEETLKNEEVTAVVLEWFNHDCPVCAKHAEDKTMINLAKNYKEKGVVFLGVDSTNYHANKNEDINKRVKEWGVNYPILTDFDGTVGRTYGAKTTPHMFIINKEGMLVYDGAIDNQRSGDGETNYVARALDQMLAGETIETPKTAPYGCSVKYKRKK